jgi:hypothetical protein
MICCSRDQNHTFPAERVLSSKRPLSYQSPKEFKVKHISKQKPSVGATFRLYWWVFAVIVALIVLALFRVATVHQEGESKLPAPTRPPLADVPESQVKSGVNAPAATRIDIATDHLELPYPQDVEALARYHGTKGRKNIRDAEAFWQKGADQYIDFLRNETFDQGTYRTYIPSELWWVKSSFEAHSASHPDIIRYLARTRRFNKLLSQVIQDRHHGKIVGLVETISRTVSRLIQERQAVEQKVVSMMITEPEAFMDGASSDQQARLVKLVAGVGSTGFESVSIPMSLQGAQLGAVANTFLLGLTGHPDAIAPIIETLAYEDQPIIEKLADACRRSSEFFAKNLPFSNRNVVADALDRILVACASNEAINQEARDLARQYKQWRDNQHLPDREVIQAFTFDSPTTPYHLPGMMTGGKEDAETYELDLPLPLWEEYLNDAPNYRLNEETIARIIDWAERFNATLKGQ